MIEAPLELDHGEDETPSGLLAWITTNVAEPAVLTREILERHIELGWPTIWSRHFEIGPEELPPAPHPRLVEAPPAPVVV